MSKALCSRCQVNPCVWVFVATQGGITAWSCADCVNVALSWFEGEQITVVAT